MPSGRLPSLRINIVLGPFAPTLPGPAGAVEKVWQGLADYTKLVVDTRRAMQGIATSACTIIKA